MCHLETTGSSSNPLINITDICSKKILTRISFRSVLFELRAALTSTESEREKFRPRIGCCSYRAGLLLPHESLCKSDVSAAILPVIRVIVTWRTCSWNSCPKMADWSGLIRRFPTIYFSERFWCGSSVCTRQNCLPHNYCPLINIICNIKPARCGTLS